MVCGTKAAWKRRSLLLKIVNIMSNAELSACAATYAYHLTQAHAFVDGNKRVAAAVSEIFVKINGARLETTNEELTVLFLGIAAGKMVARRG